jgi:hypothetical protein
MNGAKTRKADASTAFLDEPDADGAFALVPVLFAVLVAAAVVVITKLPAQAT